MLQEVAPDQKPKQPQLSKLRDSALLGLVLPALPAAGAALSPQPAPSAPAAAVASEYPVASKQHGEPSTLDEVNWAVHRALTDERTPVVKGKPQTLAEFELAKSPHFISGLLAFAAATLTWFAHSAGIVSRKRATAFALLKDRKAELARHAEELQQLNAEVDRVLGPITKLAMPNAEFQLERLQDKTRDVVKHALQRNLDANVYLAVLDKAVVEAERALTPNGFFSAMYHFIARRPARRALEILANSPCTFDPRERLELRVQGTQIEPKFAWGAVERSAGFESFSSDIAKKLFVPAASASREALKTIELAYQRRETAVSAQRERFTLLSNAIDQIGAQSQAGEKLFALPSAKDDLLPEIARVFAKIEEQSTYDPIGALRGLDKIGETLIDVEQAAEALLQARRTTLPEILEMHQGLTAHGVSAAWIPRALEEFSSSLEERLQAEIIYVRACSSAAGRDFPERPGQMQISERFNALWESATLARMLDTERRGELTQEITRIAAKVQSERETIMAALENNFEQQNGSLPASIKKQIAHHTLRERHIGLMPERELELARELRERLRSNLGKGELQDAQEFVQAVYSKAREAEALVEHSKAALQAAPRIIAERNSAHAELLRSLPEHKKLVERLRGTYAQAALLLRAGDATYPRADASVTNLGDEAEQALAVAERSIEIAEQDFEVGRLLSAASQLRRAVRAHVFAGRCFAEAVAKETDLVKFGLQNQRDLQSMRRRLVGLSAEQNDARLTEAACKRIALEASRFEALLLQINDADPARERDPYRMRKELLEYKEGLSQLEFTVSRDKAGYDELQQKIGQIERQLKSAGMVAEQLGQKQNSLDELHQQLENLKQRISGMRQPQSWSSVEQEADSLFKYAVLRAAALKNEQPGAQSALDAYESAAARVAAVLQGEGKAGRMRGRQGAQALLQTLHEARESFITGDFNGGMRAAANARAAAQEAIRFAERDEQRARKLEESNQQRIEERRHQRTQEERNNDYRIIDFEWARESVPPAA